MSLIVERMVKSNRFWIITLVFLSLLSCDQSNDEHITVMKRTELVGIPSASGVEKVGDDFWVIGDNSPWIYVIDSSFHLKQKFEIFDPTGLTSGVLAKSIKHDSEAMTSFVKDGKNVLLILGSGSKENRKKAKLIDSSNGKVLKTYDLENFYDIIMEQVKLDESDLNIEGVAVLDSRIYFFNRGKNRMISLKLNKFINFLEGKIETVKVKWISIDLPRLDGIQSGFSGAAADPEFGRIVFTASVENTSDWVSDGAALGSYLGVINMNDLHHHYVPISILIVENGEILPIKVESVAITKSQSDKIKCLLVTDSDGGLSEVLSVEIKLKN